MRLIRWEVEGYKSISSAEISIEDRTLFAGKNDSGKSNLLESLIDYQSIFGSVPSTTRFRNNSPYEDWWNVCSSRYTDEERVCLTATYEFTSNAEYSDLISKASSNTSTRPEWEDNRLETSDFKRHTHQIVLSADGLEREVLFSNVSGESIPVYFRIDGGGTIGELLFSKLDAPAEDATYSEASDLSDILTSGDLEQTLIRASEAPSEGDWYVEKDEGEVREAIGGVVEEWFLDPITKTVNSWSKVDAFRNPFPTDSRLQRSGGVDSDESQADQDGENSESQLSQGLSSDMSNLDNFLANIYSDTDSEESIDTIQRKYKETIEGVGAIEIKPDFESEDRRFKIVIERGGEEFEAHQLSAGAKQAISLVTELHKAGLDSELLIIEEPEAHLHSSAVRRVWDYVETLVEEEDLQVIVSTHSPTVIDVAESDRITLFRRSDYSRVTSVGYGEVRSELTQADESPGAFTQSQALVIVEGYLAARLLRLACRKIGPDPVKSGLRILSLGPKTEENLQSLTPVVGMCAGIGIQTRLITFVPPDEEEEEFVPRWASSFEENSEIVDHYPLPPDLAQDWLGSRWDDIEAELTNKVEESVTLGSFDMENADADLDLTDVLIHIRSQSDVDISRRQFIDVLEKMEYDSGVWEEITSELSGMLR